MEITYHGLSCLRLRGRDTQVIIDPTVATLPGLTKLNPDIVVRTDVLTDTDKLRARDGAAQEVSGPGEFEVRGVAIHGLPTEGATIMRVEVDDVRVVTVGTLTRQLTEDEIDALGHVDVLVLPVGGGDGLDALAAIKLTRAVEPAIVIPVRYSVAGGSGEYATVDTFAREMGLPDGWTAQAKLNLTGSMPNVEDTRVVVLEQRTA